MEKHTLDFLLVVFVILLQLCMALLVQHHDCPPSCDCTSTNDHVQDITYVKCVGSDVSLSFNDIPIAIEHLIIQSSPVTTNGIIRAISGFRNLKTLDLSFNSLKFLPNSMFQSVDISHIDLSSNLLEYLDEGIFNDLKYLTYLNISHNHITKIEDTAFENLKALQLLDLSFNKLHNISENLFKNLQSLKKLFLQGNNIEQWDVQILFSNVVLKVLNLSQNKISQLTGEGSLNLTELDVSHNEITNLSLQCFINFNKLEMLNVDGNLFSEVSSFVLKNLTRLKRLYMCHLRNLRYISKDAFTGLVNLQLLAICDNPIRSFANADLFQSLPSLETLDLSNNKISVLHQTTFHNNKQLKSLRITGNLLWCDCDLKWILSNMQMNSSGTRNSNIFIKDSEQLVCYNHTNLEQIHLSLLSLDQLQCGGIHLRNYTQFAKYKIGAPAFLHCQVNGQPVPVITWKTPRNKQLRYHNIHNYARKDSHTVKTVTGESFHEKHHWHKSKSYHNSLSHGDRIQVLDDGTLYIDYVLRTDAGKYVCKAENPSGFVNVSITFHLDYSVLTEVKIMSIVIGFASALAFFTLNLIYVLIVAIARRCINQKRKETIKTLIDGIENYKSTQVNKLMDNYHNQVGKIRDQYKIRLDKLRDNYGCQVDRIRGIREGCSHQVDKMRDNYNTQLSRLKDYSSHQMDQLRDMYTNQVVKIRGYGSLQMGRLRENYRLQQQHAIKLLEIMNLENCRTVIEADCVRTDSMLLDVDIGSDIRVHQQPDSSSESDYETALCSREGSPVSSPMYIDGNVEASRNETMQCCDMSSEADQYNSEVYVSSGHDQNETPDTSIRQSNNPSPEGDYYINMEDMDDGSSEKEYIETSI